MTVDLQAMTAREVVAGLMRGHAPDFKLGYGPGAATMAAARVKGIEQDSAEYGALLVYAHGFLKGMVLGKDLAASRTTADEAMGVGEVEVATYREGLIEGLSEDAATTNPTTTPGY